MKSFPFSKAKIDAIAPLSRDTHFSDSQIPRLTLKVTPRGAKSFLIRYRDASGRQRKFKIGDYPLVNPATARQLATKHLANIASGGNPATERSAARKSIRFSDLAELYLQQHAEPHLRPTTVNGYRQQFRRYLLPEFGHQKAKDITRAQVSAWHLSKRAQPTTANRAHALMRAIFNWGIDQGHVALMSNPADKVKHFSERKVQCLLSLEEVARLTSAIDAVERSAPGRQSAIDAIRFMLPTACRRGEAFKLKWVDVDFERGVLCFKEAKTGARNHPLNANLRDFLVRVGKRSSEEFVFPGRLSGQLLIDIKNTWSKVREQAELSHLRLHDIRHNVLSNINQLSGLVEAQRVAGHADVRTTTRYVHVHTDQLMDALDRHADLVRVNRQSKNESES